MMCSPNLRSPSYIIQPNHGVRSPTFCHPRMAEAVPKRPRHLQLHYYRRSKKRYSIIDGKAKMARRRRTALYCFQSTWGAQEGLRTSLRQRSTRHCFCCREKPVLLRLIESMLLLKGINLGILLRNLLRTKSRRFHSLHVPVLCFHRHLTAARAGAQLLVHQTR